MKSTVRGEIQKFLQKRCCVCAVFLVRNSAASYLYNQSQEVRRDIFKAKEQKWFWQPVGKLSSEAKTPIRDSKEAKTSQDRRHLQAQ